MILGKLARRLISFTFLITGLPPNQADQRPVCSRTAHGLHPLTLCYNSQWCLTVSCLGSMWQTHIHSSLSLTWTLPSAPTSSLASSGLVLYAVVQHTMPMPLHTSLPVFSHFPVLELPLLPSLLPHSHI